MTNDKLLPLLLVCLWSAFARAQVVESALESFNSYCQPDNTSGGVTETTTLTRSGNVAFRHRVNATLPRRAELDDCAFHNYNPDRIYWYGFSLYLPRESFRGNFEQYVAQWRFSNLAFGSSTFLNCEMFRECGGGRIFGGSGHHLTVNDGQWRYTVALQDPDCEDCQALDHVNIDLAPIRTNVWTDFVIEGHYSENQDGYLNIWMQEDGEEYRLVSAYRGRTWLHFYQERSDQRENGVLGGRVMAPNHTVGLYYGSDAAARTMYSDEIRTYQEEAGADGFATVSVDGVSRPPNPAAVGPQNWRYEDIGRYDAPFELTAALAPLTDFPDGATVGLSHHDQLNMDDDLAVIVRYGPDGSLRALNGDELSAETDFTYVTGRTDSLCFRVDPAGETYTLFVVNGANDTIVIAADYAFNEAWTGERSIGYFSWSAFGRGALGVSAVSPVFNCGPIPLTALPLPNEGGPFAVGFDLLLDGSNLEEARFGLGADAGAMAFEELAVRATIDDSLNISAINGSGFDDQSETALALRSVYPCKLTVNPATNRYSLSYLRDDREVFVARDYAYTGSVSTDGQTYFYLGTENGGCLTADNVRLLPLTAPACSERGWVATEFPTRSGGFVVEHNFTLTELPTDSIIIGISTPRDFDGPEDLAAYFTVGPTGELSAYEGSVVNNAAGLRIVPGETYRATWDVDVLGGRYGLRIGNAFGQSVTISSFVPFSAAWERPGNDFSRLVAFSPAAGGCVVLANPRLDPCGPLDWRSLELPRRTSADYDLSFLLTPRGGTFGTGEIVLSSTPVPTPQSTLLTLVMRDGRFAAVSASDTAAENRYLFGSGTTLRAELTTDAAAGTFNFNIGRFDANQVIAAAYDFGADWNGDAPAYLSYRTRGEGCIEIANLVEGEACGPEDWSAVPLQQEITAEERVTVRLTPLGNNFRDGVWGLSHLANPREFSDLGPIIQFGTDNLIRARDGGQYRADTDLPFVYGNTYELTLIVNPVTKRYNVFFKQDGDQISLATNYAFRTNWTGDDVLAYAGSRTVTAGCLEAVSDQLVGTRSQRAFADNIRHDFRYFGQNTFGFADGVPEGAYTIRLYDYVGRLVSSQKVSGRRFRHPLPDAAGVYFMMVVAEDRTWAARLKFPTF